MTFSKNFMALFAALSAIGGDIPRPCYVRGYPASRTRNTGAAQHKRLAKKRRNKKGGAA